MASLMDILAGAGNLLDLPGSSLRDILSGRNPFDQWTTPFSDVNRASGRDVLQPFLGANEETGMAGWATNPMEGLKDIAGFGAEMLLDPLNLVPLGAVGKALKGRKAARSANAAMKAERGGKYALVNPKVAGRADPFVDTQYELIQAVENNGVVPGFHASKNRISEFSDEYLGSNSAKATGIYSADAKLGHQFVPDAEMLRQYPNRSKLLGDNIHVADVDMGRTAVINIHKLKSGFSTPESVAKLKQYLTDSGFNSVRLVGGGEGRLTQNTIVPLSSSQIKVQGIENPMKLLGYTPDREVVYHGGRDWSTSATPENPYGMFDVSHLKTGEGGNMFGPGAYFADAEATSRNYQELVQDSLGNIAPDNRNELVDLLRQRYGASQSDALDLVDPTDQIPFREQTAMLRDSNGVLQEVPITRAVVESLNNARPGTKAKAADMGVSLYAVGPNGVEQFVGRRKVEIPYNPQSYRSLVGKEPTIPQARLYQLDMPPGSKDRFLKWDNPMNEQPLGVRTALSEKIPGLEDTMGQYADARYKWGTAKTEMRRLRGYDSQYLDTPEGMRWDAAASQTMGLQNNIAQELVSRTGLPEYDIRNLLENQDQTSGSDVARLLLGANPSTAGMDAAVPVAQLGVPGTKNLANSTGRTSYNYAIWDQNLLNQMRVRMIDGQRVPINPTTLIEQVQQPVARAVDSPLMSTMNPMQLQPETSPFPAAVAGAVYNALQAFNRHGGIQ